MKPRLVFPALLSAFAVLLLAGCGGSGEGSGDPASVAPASTPFYVEFTIQPDGESAANIDALAKKIAGIDDLGDLIVTELEESAAEEGEEIDFEEEIQPWLGEKAAFIYPQFNGDDFQGYGAAVEVTDTGAAEDALDKFAKSEDGPAKDGSYEGVDFKVEQDDEQTIGVFDGLFVFASDEAMFKQLVDASKDESLAESDRYSSAVSQVPSDSAADVFFDIGGLIKQSGAEIDPEVKRLLENAGIELREATLAASLVPGSNDVEIDVSTNVAGDNPPSGDASELLGSLPATSVAALASSEFGERFNEGIDQLDEQGIPGEGIEPHQLKKLLKEIGIDVKQIGSSLGDAGLFVTGNSKRSLGGAVVFTTEDAQQAKNTVSNLGLFLRSSRIPGVTAINGKASGFSIRSAELGPKPVVVLAKDKRIAIGYGLPAATAGLGESGATLSGSPAYKEAVSALGSTPISGFLDGPAALKLASALVPPGNEGFAEAKPYLGKIDYVALGSEASGDLAVAKLIVGVK